MSIFLFVPEYSIFLKAFGNEPCKTPFEHPSSDLSWVSWVLLLGDTFREFEYTIRPGIYLSFKTYTQNFVICHNYSDYKISIIFYNFYSFSQYRCQVYWDAASWICLNVVLKSVALLVRFQSSSSRLFELRSCTPQSPVFLS